MRQAAIVCPWLARPRGHLSFDDLGQYRYAVRVQDARNLVAGAEDLIPYVSQYPQPKARNHASGCPYHEDQQSPGIAGPQGRRGTCDDPSLADWKRLLLNRLHIALEEVVMQFARAPCPALEVTQHDLGLVGRLRYRDNFRQAFADRLFACLGNLVVASICLRDPVKLVDDDLADLLHSGPQINDCAVPLAIFCGKFSRLARVIKILGPQLIDDFAF